jgi:hypothetical protein
MVFELKLLAQMSLNFVEQFKISFQQKIIVSKRYDVWAKVTNANVFEPSLIFFNFF